MGSVGIQGATAVGWVRSFIPSTLVSRSGRLKTVVAVNRDGSIGTWLDRALRLSIVDIWRLSHSYLLVYIKTDH